MQHFVFIVHGIQDSHVCISMVPVHVVYDLSYCFEALLLSRQPELSQFPMRLDAWRRNQQCAAIALGTSVLLSVVSGRPLA